MPFGFAPALLVALAMLHGLLYARLVPPWQAPDEPALFEYAALIGALGRVPTSADTDPALEHGIAELLVRRLFFEYLTGQAPDPPPQTLSEARGIFFMPRQVGTDPPLYFALAAVPIRALAGRSVETQLLAVRLLGVLLTVGAVVCAYGAGRELLAEDRGFAFAVGLLVALQPMFVFIGMAAGNDALANLLGAALCWALIRAVRRGLTGRRALVLLALALLSVFTKRTLLPEVLLLALIGFGLALRRLARMPLGRAARLGLGAALLVIALGARSALAGAYEQQVAADWYTLHAGAPRVAAAPGTGLAALELRPGQSATQTLPAVAAEWAQNQELAFSARVWAAGGAASGRLAIDFGWATTEVPFEASTEGQVVRVRTFIPLYCPYVQVAICSDTGTIYADRLDAQSDRQRQVNLLANGDLRPGINSGSLPARLTRYLRLNELAWAWRSGRLLEPPPLGWELPRIFFVSFWGQFGWMSLPLVGATPWEAALGLICVGGLLGTAGALVWPGQPPWRRWALVLLLALVLAGLLFPLLNAYTQPRNQVIQQGRYLFPALAPIALLLALGWRAFLPPRWRARALVVWVAWWALFAAAGLHLILRAYHGW